MEKIFEIIKWLFADAAQIKGGTVSNANPLPVRIDCATLRHNSGELRRGGDIPQHRSIAQHGVDIKCCDFKKSDMAVGRLGRLLPALASLANSSSITHPASLPFIYHQQRSTPRNVLTRKIWPP